MSFDPVAHRESSLQGWEEAASGWRRRQEMLREWAEPVSHWMVEAIAPQPGERVLELAAGLGETGMLAAELVAPLGGVVISDQAEAMLQGARERAAALGLANLEFQVLNAEWIDLPLASVDAVLCRWGYMLMADPAAALSETRRVLRPGGRVALAVWDAIEANPWALLPAQELEEHGFAAASGGSGAPGAPAPAGASGTPGPFALGDAERVEALLAEAGFTEVEVDHLDLLRRHESFEQLWDVQLDLSRSFHDAVLARPEAEIEQIHDSLAARFAPFQDPSGRLEIPGRTLLARAAA